MMGTGSRSVLEFTLRNGRGIPRLGFSTAYVPAEETAATVSEALRAGCRYLAAGSTENEGETGRGLRASAVDREEVFLAGKAWSAESYQDVIQSFQLSTAALGTGYLDLYLLPWPERKQRVPGWERCVLDSWQAMMELYAAGKVKAIGVSHFSAYRLTPLLNATVRPMVAQAEFCPGGWDRELLLTCVEHGILMEGRSPSAMVGLRGHPVLRALSAKYGCSAEQLWRRWCLQNDVLPLACPAGIEELRNYAENHDFILCDTDKELISRMPSALLWDQQPGVNAVRRAG